MKTKITVNSIAWFIQVELQHTMKKSEKNDKVLLSGKAPCLTEFYEESQVIDSVFRNGLPYNVVGRECADKVTVITPDALSEKHQAKLNVINGL